MIRKLSIKEVGSINLEKNISSWCVKAEVKIKKRTKYHFIDKQRLYFNISKADAKKLFIKEFKQKENNLLNNPKFRKSFLKAYKQNTQ